MAPPQHLRRSRSRHRLQGYWTSAGQAQKSLISKALEAAKERQSERGSGGKPLELDW